MPYNAYTSVASTSLSASGSAIAEERIPLWIYSSGYMSSGAGYTSAGTIFVRKGTTSNSGAASAETLLNLSSSWNQSQNFCFEASIYSNGASYTAQAALWDITANAIVSGSQISTTATTFTSVRSGTFTLAPGHSYAVTLWTSSSSGAVSITKAHLIALTM